MSNRETVRSWLVRIATEKPIINKHVKFDRKANNQTNIKYECTNNMNGWVVYTFESNHPDILNVKNCF